MDISIIIVNYKSQVHTLACLRSIYEADWGAEGRELRKEIIVVDNASEDSLAEVLRWQYPEVLSIQSKRNLGMGAGNNLGLKRAQGRYVVIMNPDTRATRKAFLMLYAYMENNPDTGIVGPRLTAPNGDIQLSAHRWHALLTPLYRRTFLGRFFFAQKDLDRFLLKDRDLSRENQVDWLQGSFLFCRRQALLDTGFFDENFFMYFEDTDLCRRMWEKKWRVVYYPLAVVAHHHTRASARLAWYAFFLEPLARAHLLSWWKYLKKWGRSYRKHK